MMRELVSLEEALEIILAHVSPVGEENIDLSVALGRVLSENVFAPFSLPPFHRSPLDGYAVRAEDIAEASPNEPAELLVMQEIPAGSYSEIEVTRNQAAKILTGAPIPPGADVVIRFEDVRKAGARIKVFRPLPAYTNYCFAGEDISRGERVLSAGVRLGPAAVGILAGLGIRDLPVYRAPRIAVLSTGDELIDITGALGMGKIYNSNLYTLAALIQEAGAQPADEGTVPDRAELITRKIDQALKGADMVLTTGGVSVGDYDAVEDALGQLGAEILFWRVNIRPGTPVICAVKDGKVILSLSGNPAAALITYHLLARPAIAKLQGLSDWKPLKTIAILQDGYPKASGQRRFLRGQAYLENGVLKVKLTGLQSPGIMKSMVNCNALVDVPANSRGLKAGEHVTVFAGHAAIP
jgi:molybdopterin molybdotransferase